MFQRFAALVLAFLTVCGAAPAVDADMSGAVADVFDVSRARAPRPGEWLEFRAAFRVDPLEHSLSPERGEVAPSGRTPRWITGGDNDEFVFFAPHFEPDRVWRVVPLRIEIREVMENGCNVVMTFAGHRHELFMPKPEAREAEADFYYDADGSADGGGVVRIGDHEYEVEEMRRGSERYGLIRWTSGEVPFGIVRFATTDVDLALIGMGMGRAPDFPLEDQAEITPPLGLLYYPVSGADVP